MTHASEKRDSKTIGTVPHDQNEKYCLRAGKRTKVAIIYINKRILPTQGLRWEILYVLELNVRLDIKAVQIRLAG